jgi:D-sedoheptulose 7-phosphate isomerase
VTGDGLVEHRDQVVQALQLVGSASCERLLRLLEDCRRDGRLVAVAGNGGSAATAEHLVADWVKQGGLRVLDFCGGAPLLMALANDEGFEAVFAAQVEHNLAGGDVLVLLSTSGRSPNLLRAAMAARRRAVTVVALTGRQGSALGALADLELCADADAPEVAEDVHLSVGHAIARQLRLQAAARRVGTPALNGHAPAPW